MMEETPYRVYQEEDRLPRVLVLAVFGLMLLIGAGLVWWAVAALARDERGIRPSGIFPEKGLGPRGEKSAVLEDLYADRGRGQILNEAKRRDLGVYRWVDKQHRIVDIPIEQAMALVVEEYRR